MKYLLGMFLVLFFLACKNDSGKESVQTSKVEDHSSVIRNPINLDGTIDSNLLSIITFEEEEFDFGEIQEGRIITHTFSFTNTGKFELDIMHVKTSCGCTTTSYPEEPIAPGESGEIVVEFDSENREGKQVKPITITSNSVPSEKVLTITGTVKAKKQ